MPCGLEWAAEVHRLTHVRRLAVESDRQREGFGRALMAWAETESRPCRGDALSVGVRVELPGNLDFYQQLGYTITDRHHHDGYEHKT